jgi:alcohol dehydrogenase class IV
MSFLDNMIHVYDRSVQSLMRLVAKIIRIPEPKVYLGHKIFHKIIDILRYHEVNRILLVTDQNIIQLKIIDPLITLFNQQKIDFFIYQDTQVNPTIVNLEEAKTSYVKHQCQAIIGVGGGSAMDCGKGAAALVASGKKVHQLRGLLKVRKKPPLMIMVPTTAGTGSEATVAVVVSNPKTKEKYGIGDPVLVPSYAILDSALTIGLPSQLTATTGMDAMTHAIEAYLGNSVTPFSKAASKKALQLIHQHLIHSYQHPQDEPSRRGMLEASYQAGLAFTRSYVGYVHAVAHTLGGFYQVPHGLANAIILPHVLELYGKSIHHKLATMADWLSLTSIDAPSVVKAKALKEWLNHHLTSMHITNILPGIIKKEDIPLMVKRAQQEISPFYPVPMYLHGQVLTHLYQTLGGF